MNYFATVIELLRDRPRFLSEIKNKIRLERKMIALLVASCLFFAVYGGIIGSSSSWLQMIASAVKLPALYLITLVICLPTLYFFDILFGSGLVFSQYVTLMLTNLAVISVLLFSFAPVTLFFLISIPEYDFFLLINVAILGITGIVGVKLFYQGMLSLTAEDKPTDVAPLAPEELSPSVSKPAPRFFEDDEGAMATSKPKPSSAIAQSDSKDPRKRLLQGWLVLYALVGSQLGWTLRPFFGAPGEPFQLFRPEIEGNFYMKVIETLFYFVTGG